MANQYPFVGLPENVPNEQQSTSQPVDEAVARSDVTTVAISTRRRPQQCAAGYDLAALISNIFSDSQIRSRVCEMFGNFDRNDAATAWNGILGYVCSSNPSIPRNLFSDHSNQGIPLARLTRDSRPLAIRDQEDSSFPTTGREGCSRPLPEIQTIGYFHPDKVGDSSPVNNSVVCASCEEGNVYGGIVKHSPSSIEDECGEVFFYRPMPAIRLVPIWWLSEADINVPDDGNAKARHIKEMFYQSSLKSDSEAEQSLDQMLVQIFGKSVSIPRRPMTPNTPRIATIEQALRLMFADLLPARSGASPLRNATNSRNALPRSESTGEDRAETLRKLSPSAQNLFLAPSGGAPFSTKVPPPAAHSRASSTDKDPTLQSQRELDLRDALGLRKKMGFSDGPENDHPRGETRSTRRSSGRSRSSFPDIDRDDDRPIQRAAATDRWPEMRPLPRESSRIEEHEPNCMCRNCQLNGNSNRVPRDRRTSLSMRPLPLTRFPPSIPAGDFSRTLGNLSSSNDAQDLFLGNFNGGFLDNFDGDQDDDHFYQPSPLDGKEATFPSLERQAVFPFPFPSLPQQNTSDHDYRPHRGAFGLAGAVIDHGFRPGLSLDQRTHLHSPGSGPAGPRPPTPQARSSVSTVRQPGSQQSGRGTTSPVRPSSSTRVIRDRYSYQSNSSAGDHLDSPFTSSLDGGIVQSCCSTTTAVPNRSNVPPPLASSMNEDRQTLSDPRSSQIQRHCDGAPLPIDELYAARLADPKVILAWTQQSTLDSQSPIVSGDARPVQKGAASESRDPPKKEDTPSLQSQRESDCEVANDPTLCDSSDEYDESSDFDVDIWGIYQGDNGHESESDAQAMEVVEDDGAEGEEDDESE